MPSRDRWRRRPRREARQFADPSSDGSTRPCSSQFSASNFDPDLLTTKTSVFWRLTHLTDGVSTPVNITEGLDKASNGDCLSTLRSTSYGARSFGCLLYEAVCRASSKRRARCPNQHGRLVP